MRIVAMNKVDMSLATIDDAITMVKQGSATVVFAVCYDPQGFAHYDGGQELHYIGVNVSGSLFFSFSVLLYLCAFKVSERDSSPFIFWSRFGAAISKPTRRTQKHTCRCVSSSVRPAC